MGLGETQCTQNVNNADVDTSSLIEAPAESCTPICFHILAERGYFGEYLERVGDGAKQFRLNVMYAVPHRPVSASVVGCGRAQPKADCLTHSLHNTSQ